MDNEKKKDSLKNTPAVKVGNSTAPQEYFIDLSGRRPVITNTGRRIELFNGIPSDALELYKAGFPYLGLKPGAEVLFEKESEASLNRLIAQASRKEDIAILKRALKKL